MCTWVYSWASLNHSLCLLKIDLSYPVYVFDTFSLSEGMHNHPSIFSGVLGKDSVKKKWDQDELALIV